MSLRVLSDSEAFLDEDALQFRALVLDSFCPSAKHPNRRGVVMACAGFFNHDWRRSSVAHVCKGSRCCQSLQHSQQKGAYLVKRLLGTLRASMFSKSNWLSWCDSLMFFGIGLGMHGLLLTAFQQAFRKPGSAIPAAAAEQDFLWGVDDPQQLQGHHDAVAKKRAELAHSLAVALDFLSSPEAFRKIVWLRLPLEPQR
eukprot:647824-Amphidinium_carterae.1